MVSVNYNCKWYVLIYAAYRSVILFNLILILSDFSIKQDQGSKAQSAVHSINFYIVQAQKITNLGFF